MALAAQLPTENGAIYPLSQTPDLNGSSVPSTSASTAFEPDLFRGYLLSLLPPVLGATSDEIDESLFDSEFDEKVIRFAAEGGSVLYVQKIKLDTDDEGNAMFKFQLMTELVYSAAHAATVALVKRSHILDPLVPLALQLHILNLFGGDETPYESLHALVSHAVKPYFDAFVGAHGLGRDGDNRLGIPMTKKKFAELELSLLHLQQNVEIPETDLIIHPVIKRAVDQANATGTRPIISLIPSQTLNDSTFLNTLQNHVNIWIKSMQAVTKLSRDVSSGTASQEINFWLSLERALDGIEAQLRSDGVLTVLDCLRNAKRFRATVSFIADSGLREATDLARSYNVLMREFPLNDLLSATDLEKIQKAVVDIFTHFCRKLRGSPYPIRRALPLVDAISKDFNDQLLRVLTSHRLTYTPYETFDRILTQTLNIFKTWDEQIREFTNVAREVTRRRSEKFIPIRIHLAHQKLMDRVKYLKEWRSQHEQLALMTGPTKGLSVGKEIGGMDMEEEVKEAYELVKSIDILDVSTEGTEIWATAENAYKERVARVENQIISRLRDRLGTARNANEMFRVFSKFNGLFIRQKIRGAIQEYQTQLIDSVKEDISRLQEKFKMSYIQSQAFHMAALRDLPQLTGTIIWAKQIERQLSTYMKRVEDVLGKDWEFYAEGQKLQAESEAFRRKLDTRWIFDQWIQSINRRDMAITGKLFEITKVRGGGIGALGAGATTGMAYQLTVNFDPQAIMMFKEIRNLLWLGFQVPHAVSNMAKDAKRVYPHAVSLIETVQTYSQTLDLVENNKGIEMLVAEYRNEAQRMVARGIPYKWDYFVNAYDAHRFASSGLEGRENRHVMYVREFASTVSMLQDKTNSLIETYKEITRMVDELSTCPYTAESFSELIGKIQALIDRLNLQGYVNLDHWVAGLDQRIEDILSARLTNIIQLWCTEFDRNTEDDIRPPPASSFRDLTTKRGAKGGNQKLKEDMPSSGQLSLQPIFHEVRIQNQVIFLDPPIEYAREVWIRQLHEWIGIVCRLRRLQSSRYEIGLQIRGSSAVDLTYTVLLTKLSEGTLERPFALIEGKIQQIKEYVAKWLQFQSLWDLEAEYVFNRLGDSLANWQQLLTEIKKTRSTFDNSDTSRSFGAVVIKYEQVQARVNAKYDSWQRDILSRFGVKLGNAMKEMHASILKARHDLETHSIEGLVTGGGSRRF